MRIWLVFIFLAVVLVIPFLFLGDSFAAWLEGDGASDWLSSCGGWAWIMALLLMVADLVLPVPATAVMAGLGVIYGPWLGGLVGAAGSILSGIIAYALCRYGGRRFAVLLAGEESLEKSRSFFARSGGWMVILSRWMPLMPEVVACLAGLVRMPAHLFMAALACGSIPMAFVYAWVGHAGAGRPGLALAAAALLPLLLWWVLPIRR
ncbi:MAG: VTT domain-containing protein [Planctomycetota bacterium]